MSSTGDHEGNDAYRGSVSVNKSFRGGTEMSVKITCGVEEQTLLEKC